MFKSVVMLNMYLDTVNFLSPILIIFVNSFDFMVSQIFENSHSESNEQWFSGEGLTYNVPQGEKLFTRQFSQIFANFCQIAEIKSSRKIPKQPIPKIKATEKKNFFSFFRISKTYIFTLGSLSINDDHIKNISRNKKIM